MKTRPESSLEHLRLFGILRQRKTLCCSLREGKLTRETLVVQEKQKVECRNNQEKQTTTTHKSPEITQNIRNTALLSAQEMSRVVKKMPSIRNK